MLLEKVWEAYVIKRFWHNKAHKRCNGGGRNPPLLAIEEKLLRARFNFKVYPLKAMITAFFGMRQGRANEWMPKLSPILAHALGAARQGHRSITPGRSLSARGCQWQSQQRIR
jgi:hypothetical protein